MPLADGQVLQVGAHRVRHIDTPHVPRGWEARVLYEETTSTLLCGDLFTQLGNGPATTTGDIIGAAAQAEDAFRASCLTPDTGPAIRRLVGLNPATLAVMHGSCFTGDGPAALLTLAADYDQRLCSRHEPLITRRHHRWRVERYSEFCRRLAPALDGCGEVPVRSEEVIKAGPDHRGPARRAPSVGPGAPHQQAAPARGIGQERSVLPAGRG
jgi:hypothetical protein